jgi:glycolate oxidase
MKQTSARTVVTELGRRIGPARVRTEPEILTCYAFDATNLRFEPTAVVFPESPDEVRLIASLCADAAVPLVPRGAGTGFAGGTLPLEGGVVVSTERLNRIVAVDRELRTATVEPGVVNAALQGEAGKAGLMFPPDPSSLEVCTIGGNVAQDAGGPRALKYGVTRDYVIGVEAVLYGGAVVGRDGLAGGTWRPPSALMVGSEGTLGLITEVRLRLLPRPAAFATALAFFETIRDAATAVTLVFEHGVLPAAVELMDRETLACISRFAGVSFAASVGCCLLVETDGERDEAQEAMAAVVRAMRGAGPVEVKVAGSEREREDLWRMRRAVSPSLARIAPWKINEDVVVPRSRLPGLVDAVVDLGRRYRLRVPTFGHAGDGNLHVNVMLDRHDRDQVRRAEAVVDALFKVTVDLGGSISGEHGIGYTKMRYLPGQLGEDLVAVQRGIKRAFDPAGLLNPGKVLVQS